MLRLTVLVLLFGAAVGCSPETRKDTAEWFKMPPPPTTPEEACAPAKETPAKAERPSGSGGNWE